MEWITIKEAITLVNKSNQAIYKLSTKEEYKKYFKVSNGSKYVDKDFIINYYNHKSTGELKQTEAIQNYNEEFIEELKKTIENLRQDKEELYKQLHIKDKQIEALTETNNNTLQLLNQQQQLQYQSVEKISAPTEDKIQEQQQDITIIEKPKEETKSFFKRLFR